MTSESLFFWFFLLFVWCWMWNWRLLPMIVSEGWWCNQGYIKQTLDYIFFFKLQQNFFIPKIKMLFFWLSSAFVYMRSNTNIWKETNHFFCSCCFKSTLPYQWARFLFKREEALWWLVLNFWMQHPHRDRVTFDDGFQSTLVTIRGIVKALQL